jgi:hypothetical protein
MVKEPKTKMYLTSGQFLLKLRQFNDAVTIIIFTYDKMRI